MKPGAGWRILVPSIFLSHSHNKGEHMTGAWRLNNHERKAGIVMYDEEIANVETPFFPWEGSTDPPKRHSHS